MTIDPTIIKNVVQNVRAEVLSRAPSLKLDPALIERIAAKVPIFQGLPLPDLSEVMGMGEHRRFQAGECVFNEGDAGTSFYVLISGEVSIDKWRNGRSVELAALGPGACFGEMALVSDEARSATVRVLNDAVAVQFQRQTIDAHPGSAAVVYRNIARILAKRLGQSSLTLADLASRDEA